MPRQAARNHQDERPVPTSELLPLARRRRGPTRRDLSERLHDASGNRCVTREEVSACERGKRTPGPYWRRLGRDGGSPTAHR